VGVIAKAHGMGRCAAAIRQGILFFGVVFGSGPKIVGKPGSFLRASHAQARMCNSRQSACSICRALPTGAPTIPEEVRRRLIETQDSHETVLVHEIESFRRGLGRGNSRNDAGY